MTPWWVGLAVAAAVLGLFWVRRRLVLVTVTGTSMLPALRDGDRVLVRRAPIGSVRVGQVVVLRHPEGAAGPSAAGRRIAGEDWMIKRTVAVAGDALTAELRGGTERGRSGLGDGRPGERVPEQRLAVLGDNRAISHDSRHFGLVPASDLLGIVVWRLSVANRVG